MNRYTRKPRKYHNDKVTVGGITFDSKKEADRYCELLLLQRAGRISELQRQVKFKLLPTQRGEQRTERPVTYIADFVYTRDGKVVVEDVKGLKTREYVIKRKLMKYFHGIEINEV